MQAFILKYWYIHRETLTIVQRSPSLPSSHSPCGASSISTVPVECGDMQHVQL